MRSFKLKISGAIIATSALSLVTLSAAFIYLDYTSSAEAKATQGKALSQTIAGTLKGAMAFGDKEATKYVLNSFQAEQYAVRAVVHDKDGKPFATWTRPADDAAHIDAADTVVDVVSDIKMEKDTLGQVTLSLSTTDLKHKAERFAQLAGVMLAAAILLALCIGWFVARRLAQPVVSLSEVAMRVGKTNDYSARATEISDDEVGVLATAFNEMLGGIQQRDDELAEYQRGLEHKVEERTAALQKTNEEMSVILDNVAQGMVMVKADGTLEAQGSAFFHDWFGAYVDGQAVWEAVRGTDDTVADCLEAAWWQLEDGLLPVEVCLGQFPSAMQDEHQHFALEYVPILDDDVLTSVLVVVSDVTEKLRKEEADRRQREVMCVFDKAMSDAKGFISFFDETTRLVGELSPQTDGPIFKRQVHTLKGNAGMYGLVSVVDVCHDLETDLDEGERPATAADCEGLRAAWEDVAKDIQTIVDGSRDNSIRVAPAEFAELLDAARVDAGLHGLLSRLQNEPTSASLHRLATQSQALANKLGKGAVDVVIEDNDIRTSANLSSFWQVLVHVARNAIDHGMETVSEREAAGKAGARLTLSTTIVDDELVVSVADNGRGVDWERIRAKAKGLGVGAETSEELVAALFSDGLSTRDEATELSGRGVGMAAVKEEVERLGGHVDVKSEKGEGTTFVFVIPVDVAFGFAANEDAEVGAQARRA